jgi:hypothetical protein
MQFLSCIFPLLYFLHTFDSTLQGKHGETVQDYARERERERETCYCYLIIFVANYPLKRAVYF